jgi:hypothetical protein
VASVNRPARVRRNASTIVMFVSRLIARSFHGGRQLAPTDQS